MLLNHVVVIFDSGEVVTGIVTATHNECGGGIFLHADGAEMPARRDFNEMRSMTVIG